MKFLVAIALLAVVDAGREKRYSSYSYKRRTCVTDANGHLRCSEEAGSATSPPRSFDGGHRGSQMNGHSNGWTGAGSTNGRNAPAPDGRDWGQGDRGHAGTRTQHGDWPGAHARTAPGHQDSNRDGDLAGVGGQRHPTGHGGTGGDGRDPAGRAGGGAREKAAASAPGLPTGCAGGADVDDAPEDSSGECDGSGGAQQPSAWDRATSRPTPAFDGTFGTGVGHDRSHPSGWDRSAHRTTPAAADGRAIGSGVDHDRSPPSGWDRGAAHRTTPAVADDRAIGSGVDHGRSQPSGWDRAAQRPTPAYDGTIGSGVDHGRSQPSGWDRAAQRPTPAFDGTIGGGVDHGRSPPSGWDRAAHRPTPAYDGTIGGGVDHGRSQPSGWDRAAHRTTPAAAAADDRAIGSGVDQGRSQPSGWDRSAHRPTPAYDGTIGGGGIGDDRRQPSGWDRSAHRPTPAYDGTIGTGGVGDDRSHPPSGWDRTAHHRTTPADDRAIGGDDGRGGATGWGGTTDRVLPHDDIEHDRLTDELPKRISQEEDTDDADWDHPGAAERDGGDEITLKPARELGQQTWGPTGQQQQQQPHTDGSAGSYGRPSGLTYGYGRPSY